MKPVKVDCNQCESRDKSIFCQLETENLNNISTHKIMNSFKRGQVLFHEGNPAFGVYCISQGKVKLTKNNENGKETLLRIVGAGDLVGFQQLVQSGTNDVTATALEDTRICFLDRGFLQDVVKNNSSCSMELLSHLAKDMAELQDRLNGLQNKTVRERVAFLLLDLSARFGIETPTGKKLGVNLSREEMASMLGIASETLIRELSVLKEEKILEQEGKSIILLKPDLLESTIGFI